jgi:hypothetical protein
VVFVFHKQRKFERLRSLLEELKIPYKSTIKKRLRVTFKREHCSEALQFLTDQKRFNTKIVSCNYATLKSFIDELFYWDGLFTRKNTYCSKYRENADIVQAVAAQIGCRCRIRLYKGRYYNTDFTWTRESWTTNNKVVKLDGLHDVYCVKVPSGWIVTRYNNVTSISGNCQNIPAAPEYRECFEAPEGYTFVVADYSQMEARLLADLSKEQVLIDMFAAGVDYHLETAKKAFKNENLTIDSPERKLAKNVGFAIAFGGGAKTVHERYKVPLQNAKELVENYFKVFPRLKEYFEEQGELARSRGYIVIDNNIGRKSYLPNFDIYKFCESRLDVPKYASLYRTLKSQYQRMAQNYRPQGTGASIAKRAGIKLRAAGITLILLVHDEYVVLCKEEDAISTAKILTEAMVSSATEYCGIEIPAKAVITKYWHH